MVVEAKVAVEEVEVCQPINGTLGALESDVDGILGLAHKEPTKTSVGGRGRGVQ